MIRRSRFRFWGEAVGRGAKPMGGWAGSREAAGPRKGGVPPSAVAR